MEKDLYLKRSDLEEKLKKNEDKRLLYVKEREQAKLKKLEKQKLKEEDLRRAQEIKEQVI